MSNNRIAKPSRSKATVAPKANVNPAITPEMLASAMAILQAAGMPIPTATAETPKTSKPRYESGEFAGGTIWISNMPNGKSKIWIDGVNESELRKLIEFSPAEYKAKSSK